MSVDPAKLLTKDEVIDRTQKITEWAMRELTHGNCDLVPDRYSSDHCRCTKCEWKRRARDTGVLRFLARISRG